MIRQRLRTSPPRPTFHVVQVYGTAFGSGGDDPVTANNVHKTRHYDHLRS